MTSLVRVSTAKAVLVLLGLFNQGEPLRWEEHPDHRGYVYTEWTGRRGGVGALYLDARDERARAAAEGCRSDPAQEVRFRALLATAWRLDGVERGWHTERVAELVHGPRRPRRSRDRQLRPVSELLYLFEHGHFIIEGDVAAGPRPDAKEPRGTGRLRYGSRIEGPLLEVERHNHRTATLRLAPDVREALNGPGGPGTPPPFTNVPAETFRLDITGHRNPHGDVPSRAFRRRLLHAAHDYGRLRQSKADREGQVQAIRWQDLATSAGLSLDGPERRRRLESFFDQAEQDLAASAAAGNVGLAVKPDRAEHPRRRLLRLSIPDRDRLGKQRTAPAAHRARRHQTPRPVSSGSTPSGDAVQRGP